MATVTGLTAERMQEIVDAVVVDANIVGDNLVLILHDGTTIDAGNVRGIQGIQGIPGSISSSPAGGDLAGNYPNPTIKAAGVTTAKLADGSVTGAKLAPGAIPAPDLTAILDRLDELESNPRLVRDTESISFNASGDGVISHGLGQIPAAVGAMIASHEGQIGMLTVVNNSINATTFTVRLRNTSGIIPNVPRTISWYAST